MGVEWQSPTCLAIAAFECFWHCSNARTHTDSSIFFYLMDPLGQFVDAFGKASTEAEVTQKTREAIAKWEAAGGNKAAGVPE